MILKNDTIKIVYIRPARQIGTKMRAESTCIKFRSENFERTTTTFPTDEDELHKYLRCEYANRMSLRSRYP